MPTPENLGSNHYEELSRIQQLVNGIVNVERHHYIAGSERHENVIEHSFAVTMLCWKMYEAVRPPLSLEAILKRALVHDFTERGLSKDISAFAGPEERRHKESREAQELTSLIHEFDDFTGLKESLQLDDEVERFVYTVDKIQAIVHGQMDEWRAYVFGEITHDQYQEKHNAQLDQCSPYLRDIFRAVIEHGQEHFYHQPENSQSTD